MRHLRKLGAPLLSPKDLYSDQFSFAVHSRVVGTAALREAVCSSREFCPKNHFPQKVDNISIPFAIIPTHPFRQPPRATYAKCFAIYEADGCLTWFASGWSRYDGYASSEPLTVSVQCFAKDVLGLNLPKDRASHAEVQAFMHRWGGTPGAKTGEPVSGSRFKRLHNGIGGSMSSSRPR